MSWKTRTNLPFTPGFSQKGAWTAPKPPPTKKKTIPEKKKKKNSQNNSAPFGKGIPPNMALKFTEITIFSYPKDHWTLQWKGLNLYYAGVGSSK